MIFEYFLLLSTNNFKSSQSFPKLISDLKLAYETIKHNLYLEFSEMKISLEMTKSEFNKEKLEIKV